MLRRTRGGQHQMLKHLWPKLKLIVSVDVRMTTTGLWSDIVLPAAHHYEKPNFPYTTPDVMNLTLSDRVVDPPEDTKSEWQFALALARKLSERAVAREYVEFQSRLGMPVRLDNPVRGRSRQRLLRRRRDRDQRDGRRLGRRRHAAGGDDAGVAARVGLRALHQLGAVADGAGAGVGPEAGRDALAVPLADGEEGAVPDADAPRAVLHRPRLVPGSGRGAARTQGAAGAGRRLPARDDGRTSPLECELHEHDEPDHPQHAARRVTAYINDADAATRGIEDGDEMRVTTTSRRRSWRRA